MYLVPKSRQDSLQATLQDPFGRASREMSGGLAWGETELDWRWDVPNAAEIWREVDLGDSRWGSEVEALQDGGHK